MLATPKFVRCFSVARSSEGNHRLPGLPNSRSDPGGGPAAAIHLAPKARPLRRRRRSRQPRPPVLRSSQDHRDQRMTAQFPVQRVQLRPTGGIDGAREAQVPAGLRNAFPSLPRQNPARAAGRPRGHARAMASPASPMILSGKGTWKLEQAFTLIRHRGPSPIRHDRGGSRRNRRGASPSPERYLNHRRTVSTIRPTMPATGTASSASTG
jgi:hypothetical protein